MPRARRNNDKNDHKNDIEEEDHLSVDPPIPGQKYACISFVSPEKIIESKTLYMYYHYSQSCYKKLSELMSKSLLNLIETSNDGNVDITDVIKIKKQIENIEKDNSVDFTKFKENIENFIFSDEDLLGEKFDKENNFMTSVRGIKIRCVYDTELETKKKAAELRLNDPNFDIYVCPVGMWCPWQPDVNKISDVEYLNSDLNKLVGEYKKNETKKNQFYQEQKSNRQKEVLSAEDRLKHQSGLADMREYQDTAKEQKAKEQENKPLNNMDNLFNENSDNKQDNNITQSIVTGNSQDKEITIEQQTTILESDDPWLQRMNK